MKLMKKITSALLSLALIAVLFASLATSSSAISIISDENYDYAVLSDQALALYRYTGTDSEITLPEGYGGRPVIGIYSDCFEDSFITSVTIPDSYTYISDSAFYGCESLTGIKIPKGIKTIGMLAFSGCTSLASFDISEAESLKKLPEAVCAGDTSLKSVYIPYYIESIGVNAFADTGLESIELPSSVTNVGSGAFSGCSSLGAVQLSESLTQVSNSAFINCSALTTIQFPETITRIGNSAFEGCTLLSDVELTPYITEIGVNAFYNASSLKSLYIPNNVTSIGADAFAPMSYNNTIEVICFADSYAEEYCENNLVKHKTPLMGDSNLDGIVNINDVTTIQLYLVGQEDLIPTYYAKAITDVYKDGKISIRDATKIQMYLAGIITEL